VNKNKRVNLCALLTSGFFGRPRPRPDLGLGAGCAIRIRRHANDRSKKKKNEKPLCAPKPFRWGPCAGGRVRASRRGRRRGCPLWRPWLPWQAWPPWPQLPVEKEEEATRDSHTVRSHLLLRAPALALLSFVLAHVACGLNVRKNKRKTRRHSGRAEQTALASQPRASQPRTDRNAPLHQVTKKWQVFFFRFLRSVRGDDLCARDNSGRSTRSPPQRRWKSRWRSPRSIASTTRPRFHRRPTSPSCERG
jgi:hypothetical protein